MAFVAEDCGTASSGASYVFLSSCLQHLQCDVGTKCYHLLLSSCENHIAKRNYFSFLQRIGKSELFPPGVDATLPLAHRVQNWAVGCSNSTRHFKN